MRKESLGKGALRCPNKSNLTDLSCALGLDHEGSCLFLAPVYGPGERSPDVGVRVESIQTVIKAEPGPERRCIAMKAGEHCLRFQNHSGRHQYESDPPPRVFATAKKEVQCTAHKRLETSDGSRYVYRCSLDFDHRGTHLYSDREDNQPPDINQEMATLGRAFMEGFERTGKKLPLEVMALGWHYCPDFDEGLTPGEQLDDEGRCAWCKFDRREHAAALAKALKS